MPAQRQRQRLRRRLPLAELGQVSVLLPSTSGPDGEGSSARGEWGKPCGWSLCLVAFRHSLDVSVRIISLIKSWNMQKQRGATTTKFIYSMTFFFWLGAGTPVGQGGSPLWRHESWVFFFHFEFLWCLKSGKWVRVAAAAPCRKYPTTTKVTSCYCCCCCHATVCCGFRVVGWASKTVTHGVCVICAIFFPKRSSCRPKGQAAAAVDGDVNHSAAATLRDSAPALIARAASLPLWPSASAGQLARNWPTLGQHGSINGVNSKRETDDAAETLAAATEAAAAADKRKCWMFMHAQCGAERRCVCGKGRHLREK